MTFLVINCCGRLSFVTNFNKSKDDLLVEDEYLIPIAVGLVANKSESTVREVRGAEYRVIDQISL